MEELKFDYTLFAGDDTTPAGPLAQFIKEENFVSGVSEDQVSEA